APGAFLKTASVQMQFDADLRAATDAKVVVTETCRYEPTVGRAVGTAVGKMVKGKSATTEAEPEFIVEWMCKLDGKLPEVKNTPVAAECKATNNTLPFSTKQALKDLLKDKKIEATLNLRDKKETFAKDYCAGASKDRVIFHLDGGVAGRAL